MFKYLKELYKKYCGFTSQTKTNRILEYLEAGNTITQLDAIDMFGCTRLADVIFRLNKRGYYIVNLNKRGKHAEYKMERGL